jgi:hypothetical protein
MGMGADMVGNRRAGKKKGPKADLKESIPEVYYCF